MSASSSSPASSAYVVTDRSRVRRVPGRASYDQAVVHAILDEGLVAHVGFATGDAPFVIPMVYARRGEELLFHGAVASRLGKHAAAGATICATVTLLDGLVLARSAFHHSMNYRSVVVFGHARVIENEDEKTSALGLFLEHVLQGRAGASRAPNAKELAATRVFALPIEEASAKVRTGGPIDDEEDFELPYWAGTVPISLVAGTPVPDAREPRGELPLGLRGRELLRLGLRR